MRINEFSKTNFKNVAVKQAKPVLKRFQSSSINQANLESSFTQNISPQTSLINFTRKWKEHNSWGAVVNPETKDVTFKLFTFPDAKSVKAVVIKKDSDETLSFELKNKKNGVFETAKPIPNSLVQDGDSYYYEIKKNDGEIVKVKDPYSFKQDVLMGESVIYDHSKYEWNDDDWYKNPNRIVRQENNKGKNLSLNDAKIFEINVATYSDKGDFKSAAEKYDEVIENGFNAVEIMPVENTYSFNWGYDGVDKFAVSKFLGGSDELKNNIDAAHSKGLNVIIDMVPNHHGPDGSELSKTGPYIKGPNDFGDAYNFEGKDSRYVRDYMVNAALNWIKNYHVDGIRFDMTKYMCSDITMKQIAAEINYHYPDVFIIAEDSRTGVETDGENFWDNHKLKHDHRVTKPLKGYEYAKGKDENAHNEAIDDLNSSTVNLSRLGFDSEWDFNYFHVLKDNLYGDSNLDAFEDACIQGQGRVKYVMSHDEIGNFEGSRLIPKLIVPMLHLNENISLNNEDIKRAHDMSELKGIDFKTARKRVLYQKAQFVSEKIAMLYADSKLDKYFKDNDFIGLYEDVLKKLDIDKNANITPRRIKFAYDKAFSASKMATAITYTQKGPKMVFQGDEQAALSPFRFFRQFQSIENEDYLYTEKGYKPGKSAYEESVLKDESQHERYKKGFKNLVKDLNKLSDENKAISSGRIVAKDTIKHYGSQVIGMHFRDDETKNDIYTIANFSDLKYPRDDADEYYIKFPKGKWVEILNTDDEKYSGFGYTNKNPIISDGQTNLPITLGNRSTLIFKKVG